MRGHPNILLVIIICFSFLTSKSTCFNTKEIPRKSQESKVKGMFVFGSSLVDNGNNNFLNKSRAKADYLPYGVDFGFGPSGRFTNGRNVIDLIGEKLKLPSYIPPFNDPLTKGSRIVNGVNYASGGSGILDETGSIAGEVISLSQQIRNLENVTMPELREQLGSNDSSTMLSNYLFVIGTGGNDFLFNYFLRPTSKDTASLQPFISNLITTLTLQLKKLYSLGARKFVLIGVNPNGCTPIVKAMDPSQKGCIERVNQATLLFNYQLRKLADSIKLNDMPESYLVFFDSFKTLMDIINTPPSKGFEDTSSPCCEVQDKAEGGILCKKGGSICANRNSHVFFDGLHPTEAVNIKLAKKAHDSSKSHVYPMNIKQLVQL
ncbi:hypothetical protein Leryth_007304 [Lithospermum erythrorhizon]|nr:hypothetical protein Leryth_007304 [Lithospermum erythrorhizon]